jgi:hypothetical protein
MVEGESDRMSIITILTSAEKSDSCDLDASRTQKRSQVIIRIFFKLKNAQHHQLALRHINDEDWSI